MDPQVNKPSKKIGCGTILAWVIGISSILSGIVLLFTGASETKSFLSGLGVFYILAGLSVFPPFWNFVKSKWNFEISGALKVVLFFVLITIGPLASVKSLGNTNKINSINQRTSTNNDLVKSTPLTEPISTTKPTVTPIPTIAVLKVSTSEFIKEFDKNQLAAEEKYKKKLIEFTAVIDNISEDILGKPFLSLKPTADKYYTGTSIQCYFQQKSELTPLSNGQTITLQGTVRDQSLGIIGVDNCKVISSN